MRSVAGQIEVAGGDPGRGVMSQGSSDSLAQRQHSLSFFSLVMMSDGFRLPRADGPSRSFITLPLCSRSIATSFRLCHSSRAVFAFRTGAVSMAAANVAPTLSIFREWSAASHSGAFQGQVRLGQTDDLDETWRCR